MSYHLIYWLPRFRIARERMRKIEEWRSLSREEIQARQLARINAIWSRARVSSPYYIRLAVGVALPESFASLGEFSRLMPILERETLRHRAKELVGEQVEAGFWVQTGGSTGIPTPVYKDREGHGWNLATQYFHRQRLGVDIFSPMAMLWGHSVSFAPGLKGLLKRMARPLQDKLRNRLRLSVYDLSPGTLVKYVAHLQGFRPVLLYGYASALYLLAEAVEQTRGQWPELKAVVSSSEVLPDVLRDQIGRVFGVPPCEEYGAIECGIMATSLPGKKLEIEEHNVFFETVPNASGSYDILVTALWSQSMPLFRYRIGDCCETPPVALPSGYRTLGRVIGRRNDNLVGGDGRIVHSEAVSHVLKYYDQCIGRFTAIQAVDGSVTVQVEAVAGRETPVADLKQRFSELLRRPVEIAVFDRLPPSTVAGKHRWVISQFKDNTRSPS